ncbi:MAG: hypothetical protein V1493_00930 [Candidatus Diapherotrites archaeon]
MGERGILFTAMVFLMILSILALNATVKENRALEQHFTVPAKILRVSELFENIQKSMVELNKSSEATAIEKRVLPFDYNISQNTTYTGFGLPIDANSIKTYRDTLNLAKVMLEDPNYDRIYSGLDVNISTIGWDNNAPAFHYLIEPYCYGFAFDQNDANFGASKSGKCLEAFDFSRVDRIDVNIRIYQANDDYNSPACNPACPSELYDPADTNPYFSVTIDDSACPKCNISPKNIYGHLDADQEITIACQRAVCNSPPITIVFGSNGGTGVSITHNSSRAEFSIQHTFDGNVSSFQFLDFNVSVSTPDRKIIKSNYMEAIG